MTRLADAVRLGDMPIKTEQSVEVLGSRLKVIEPALRHVQAPVPLALLEKVRGKVSEYWPMHWLLVEALLSACATLRLGQRQRW
jgi:hypothetical protein